MPKLRKRHDSFDTREIPEKLRPYIFHGMDLDWSEDSREAVGDCPFCDGESKAYINIEKGLFNCKTCSEGLNATTFLRQLWEASDRRTTEYGKLVEDRGLRHSDTLMSWGVVRCFITGRWLVPGWNELGNLCQLYVYTKLKGKMRLLATPTLSHQLHGADLYDKDKPCVFLCEGPWDGIALWEALRSCKEGKDGTLVSTANPERSLAADINVLAVPGCNVFFDKWLPLFEGKKVVMLFDNDYPREVKGKTVQPASIAGMRRVARMLNGVAASIEFVRWGEEEELFSSALPSGYDVREALGASIDGKGAYASLAGLLGSIASVPPKWLEGPKRAAGDAKGNIGLEPVECLSYRKLINQWRKALKWTPGLDHALAVMLASISSTKSVGDQLWIKVIGPAACGKSTLCEAISVNQKYIVAKSTIRGFHSGYKLDGNESQDHSLIASLYDKTLVTKDGDTLLQAPNLSQILSEARDLYDSTSRTHYRNSMSKDYQGVRMTWILCGTSSLRSIDSSELGERFLDCVIMEGIDDELEDEILSRVVSRAERNVDIETNCDATTQQDPNLVIAMQLTGGYVGYLRENAARLLPEIEVEEEAKDQCITLGKFVAYMRARPSYRQEETNERELASRLVSQHMRLAKCLALVLNRGKVDSKVMERVTRVALDTARGQTLEITARLYESKGMTIGALATYTNNTEDKVRRLLRFLQSIGVVDNYNPINSNGIRSSIRWRLVDRIKKLYSEVVKEQTV